MNIDKSIINCMFCNKDENEVKKLFTGRKANICDDCVKIAFTLKKDSKNIKLVRHHLLTKDFKNDKI